MNRIIDAIDEKASHISMTSPRGITKLFLPNESASAGKLGKRLSFVYSTLGERCN